MAITYASVGQNVELARGMCRRLGGNKASRVLAAAATAAHSHRRAGLCC